MGVSPAILVERVESLLRALGPRIEPGAVGPDQIIRNRRAGLLAADGVARGAMRGKQSLAALRQAAVDRERVLRRLKIENPGLDALETRQVDRLRTRAIADAGIAEDFGKRGIQPVPMQAEIATRPEIPQRDDVRSANRAVV